MNNTYLILIIIILISIIAYYNKSLIESMGGIREITMHYTEWCIHCKNMKPVFTNVVDSIDDAGIKFKTVDEDIAKTPGINSYPTIKKIENGKTEIYKGSKNFAELRAWVLRPVRLY